MADVFSKQKRSQIMAAIHGKGNRSTERRLRARLAAAGIAGWRINAAEVAGKPDFVFSKKRIAVFIDGCFWHGCRKCRNLPATNRKFWSDKIGRNQKRDRAVNRLLKKSGWRVIRFWEHEMKRRPEKCLAKLLAALRNQTAV